MSAVYVSLHVTGALEIEKDADLESILIRPTGDPGVVMMIPLRDMDAFIRKLTHAWNGPPTRAGLTVVPR